MERQEILVIIHNHNIMNLTPISIYEVRDRTGNNISEPTVSPTTIAVSKCSPGSSDRKSVGSKNNNIIVSLEGNIGAGKSTLLKNLAILYANNPKVVFIQEPVDTWGNIKDGNNETLLEKFYKDPKTYSFSFQIMAFISRLTSFIDAVNSHKDCIIITERSLYTDNFVFAQMLFDQGKIEDVNYQIYQNLFESLTDKYFINKIIYLKTDPKICYGRVNCRARVGEEFVSLKYLEECGTYHNNLVKREALKLCEKIEINGDNDIFKIPAIVEDLSKKIGTFIGISNT